MSNQNDAPESEMSDDDLDKIIAEMSEQEEHGADAKKFEVDAQVADASMQSEMSKLMNDKPEQLAPSQPVPVEEAKAQAQATAPVLSVVPTISEPVTSATVTQKTAPSPVPSGEGQMLSMELTGAINLKLCFTGPGKKIEVQCTEEFLLCRMADGTEFKIPTGLASKKSA